MIDIMIDIWEYIGNPNEMGDIWGFPARHGGTQQWLVYHGKSHLEMDEN